MCASYKITAMRWGWASHIINKMRRHVVYVCAILDSDSCEGARRCGGHFWPPFVVLLALYRESIARI